MEQGGLEKEKINVENNWKERGKETHTHTYIYRVQRREKTPALFITLNPNELANGLASVGCFKCVMRLSYNISTYRNGTHFSICLA